MAFTPTVFGPSPLEDDLDAAYLNALGNEVERQENEHLSIKPRVLALANPGATPTFNTDLYDAVYITGQTANITSMTSNMTGTPGSFQKLWVAIIGTAARTIAWGTGFENGPVALPSTTTTTERLDVGFVWNPATSKWRCVASGSAA